MNKSKTPTIFLQFHSASNAMFCWRVYQYTAPVHHTQDNLAEKTLYLH